MYDQINILGTYPRDNLAALIDRAQYPSLHDICMRLILLHHRRLMSHLVGIIHR